MTKNNPHINYDSALNDLFDKLKDAEKNVKADTTDNPYKYARAYGHLQGAIKMCLFVTDTATYEEIDEALTGKKNTDDIPTELYNQTKS